MAEIAYLNQLTYDEAVDNLAHDLDVRRAVEEERLVHDQEQEEEEAAQRNRQAQHAQHRVRHSQELGRPQLLAAQQQQHDVVLQLADRQPMRGTLRHRHGRHAPGAHNGHAIVKTWLSQQTGGQAAADLSHPRRPPTRRQPWRLQTGTWHDQLMSQLTGLINALPVISPDSLGRQLWETFIMVLVLYNAVSVPLDVSYGMPEKGNIANYVEYAVDLVFAVDITSTFRTAYVDHAGHLVRDTSAIAMRYLRMWFWIDLFATIPYDLLVGAIAGEGSSTQITVLGFLRTPRLLRLGRLIRLLDRLKGANLVRVFVVVAFMMLISHWLACIWYMLYKFTSFADFMDWGIFLQGEILPDSTISAYLSAYYQSFLMMVGNSQPSYNNLERVFMILVLILGACFYSAMVGQMAVLVANMNTVGLRHRMKQDTTMDVLRYMGLPDGQMERVQAYFGYIMQVNHPAAEGLAFLTDLPKGLLQDVTGWLYQRELAKVTLFADLEPSFLASLAVRMRIVTYTPGETIFRAGDLGLEMYIIRKGCVAVVGKRDQLMGMLTQGDSFGEIAMFTMAKRTARCVALSSCDLCVLNTYDLKVAMKDFPSSSQQLQAQAQAKLRQLQVAGRAGYIEEEQEEEEEEDQNPLYIQPEQPAGRPPACNMELQQERDVGGAAGQAGGSVCVDPAPSAGCSPVPGQEVQGEISGRHVRRTQSNLSGLSVERTSRSSCPTNRSHGSQRAHTRPGCGPLQAGLQQENPTFSGQQGTVAEGQESPAAGALCACAAQQMQARSNPQGYCSPGQARQDSEQGLWTATASLGATQATLLEHQAGVMSPPAAVAEGRDGSFAGSIDAPATQSVTQLRSLARQDTSPPAFVSPFVNQLGKRSSAELGSFIAGVDGALEPWSVAALRQGSVTMLQQDAHHAPQWVRVAATGAAGAPRVFTATTSTVTRVADKEQHSIGHRTSMSSVVSALEAAEHAGLDMEHGFGSVTSTQPGNPRHRNSTVSRPTSAVGQHVRSRMPQSRRTRPPTAVMGSSSGAREKASANALHARRSSYDRRSIDTLQLVQLEQLLGQAQLGAPASSMSHAAADLDVDRDLGADDWLRVAPRKDGVRVIRVGSTLRPHAENWRSSNSGMPASIRSALSTTAAAVRSSTGKLRQHESVAQGSSAGDLKLSRHSFVLNNSEAGADTHGKPARTSSNAVSVPESAAVRLTGTGYVLGRQASTEVHSSVVHPAGQALATYSSHADMRCLAAPGFHGVMSLGTHSHASDVETLQLQLSEVRDIADKNAAAAVAMSSQLFRQIASLLQLVEGLAARVVSVEGWMDSVDGQLHSMEAMQATLTHKDNVLGANLPVQTAPRSFQQQLQRSMSIKATRRSSQAQPLGRQPSNKRDC